MSQSVENTSSHAAGVYPASAFAYGLIPTAQAGIVQTGNTATGAGTSVITRTVGLVPLGSVVLNDGRAFQPFATTAPISVADANAETLTPSAVSVNTDGSVTITGDFTALHGQGALITSGTVGLQEAINFASSQGGGVVVIDSTWVNLGGTTAILNAATVPAGVYILDYRGTILTALTGASDVLAFPAASNGYEINTAGVDATTLATPGAGDIGKRLFVTSSGAHAHTITTAANKIQDGSGTNGDTLTFAADAGANCQLVAINGFWQVVSLKGVTLSEV